MTHLHPEKRRRHRLSSCRKGIHSFGSPQHIGAGIVRQVCSTCAAVSIDITDAYPPLANPLVRPLRQPAALAVEADQP